MLKVLLLLFFYEFGLKSAVAQDMPDASHVLNITLFYSKSSGS